MSHRDNVEKRFNPSVQPREFLSEKNENIFGSDTKLEVLMCSQSCQTLCKPMEHRPSGFSVHVTFQARKQMGCYLLLH